MYQEEQYYFAKFVVSLDFAKGNKFMRFDQEYKSWNILKENIKTYFDMKDPKILKFRYRRANKRVGNISRRFGTIYIRRI